MVDLTEYERWLARNKSESTIRGYSNSVGNFLKWLKRMPMDGSAVERYIRHLEDVHNAPRSVARHIYAVRNYYKYMRLEGEFRDIVIPTHRAKEPDFLSKKEVSVLISASGSPRERAMLMLLYDAALRAGELVEIRREDVDFQKRELRVRTEKSRTDMDYDLAPLSKKTLAAVSNYIESSGIGPGYLFPGKNGPITTSSLRDVVGKIGDRAGIRHVYPHALRHSRATHIMQDKGGEALPYISKLLRHSNITTTMIYTHFDTKAIRKNITDAFPDGE